MADEPILGLFDSDSNFLDELTGGGSDLGGVMSSDGDNMLGQAMHMPPGPPNTMMMGQPPHQGPAQGYSQCHPAGQDSYTGMTANGGGMATPMGGPGPQQPVMNHQYSSGDGRYSQYGSMAKLHHPGDSMMGIGVQHQVMQQQQGPPPQQQQYGSPPAGSAMVQQHGSYQGYGMGGGHMGQQQQPMGMMGQQGGGWNQTQTSPTHPQYLAQQQPQCMQQPMQQGYMGHSEYGMQQNSHQQHLGHYGDGASQPAYMQAMGSPGAGMQQASPMSSPGGMSMLGGPMQHASQAQQPFPSQPHPHNPASMSPYSMHSHQQQQPQRYPGDYPGQRPQLSGPGSNQAKLQHFQYSQQHQAPAPGSQGLSGETSGPVPMGHYSNHSPNSYMPPYPGASHVASAPSSCPSSSQPMPPSHPPPMSQGAYGQSSLQELEQLVSPAMSSAGMPSTNPYQQIMQSSASSTSSMHPQSPSYSSASFQTTTDLSTASISSSAQIQYSSPLSPNPAMPQTMGPQSGISMEIQRLEKQIQHLFSMPQTQQISQQMLDLQERLRILKAQQQQQIMQMQRQQQQQQQMQMASPTRMPQKPGFGPQSLMGQKRGMGPGQMNGPPPSQMPVMAPMGMGNQHMGQGGALMGGQTQLQMGPQHMSQQISPQRPPSQSTPMSSPQRIQPFQSPTSSTPGDGMSSQAASTTQPHIVQQAADSMTTDMPPPMIDSMQLTPPTVHSLLEVMPDGDSQMTLHGVMSSSSHLRVLTPDPLPATVTEIAEAQEGQGEKPKRKRERKPKAEKVDKPPKTPRTPKAPKPPKEPKAPKPPKEPKAPKSPRAKSPKVPKEPKEPKTPRIRKSKKARLEADSSLDISDTTIISMETDAKLEGAETMIPTVVEVEIVEEKLEDSPKKKMLKEKKPKTPKTIVKALKKPSAKKRKPPASLFLKGKKRKRAGSDGSDVEMATTPPESPLNEDSNKRRSARNTKRKKYLDDLDLNLSDDDNQPLEAVETTEGPVAMKTETEEDAMIVERILGSRMRKRDIEDAEENPSIEDEEEFLVKYKNYSFLHCEWRTLPELERDKRIHSKVKRYKLKKQQLSSYFEEPEDEEYFNPDYVEVDRVLDMVTTTDPVTKEEVTHYLVKWRSLSYEESTWELEQDVDPRKVQIFKELRTPPSEDQRQVLARPKPSQWQKLEKSQAYKGNNVLRDYQLEGLNWLTFCWYNSQNCILADEMGLGKTIQSITFLNEVYQYGIKGPFLVIVPLSTVGNWQREFETWTDMNAVVYHGTSHSRNMIQEYELFYKDENGQRIPDLFRFQALITTYEIIIADVELLSSIEWRCAIIDEAHRLKNKNCRLLEGLRLFDLEHRVLLTGTPLQNNTEELFSLLNFLNPGKFSSSQAFAKDFGELKTENQVDELKEILKPMMLRRLKEDVEKNLAPKEETIIEVELTNIQKKYYRAILERNFQFLSKGGTSSVPSLMNTMMELRKCCNHPYLINGAEEQIVLETGSRGDMEHLLAAMINSSGKMVLLDKLLPRLKQNGHKVLIFSQMIRVLDIIEDYLMQKKYLFERLDGRIRGNLRQEAIDRFSKPDSDRFAFLLCTRAGGLGINLTAADTVIIYDSDWNPQNDLQAQARCHRIGQSKAVKVYRLITRNSYEREMFDKASLKLGLDKAVLQSMGGEKPANAQSQMSKKEIEDLLKKGAYGAIMDDDNAGDKFCEEDIDLILERRTKVIQIESEGKGSTFAKASFSMTSNRNDIDINDPNFWQKWAKKADLDVEALGSKNALIIEEPRQRRQTARYGKEESVVDMSDLESSSDSDSEMRFSCRKGRKSRRGRGNDDDYTYNDGISSEGYTRSDCFKVEKHLLVYGWGRWKDILAHARFKHTLMESDVQIIARAILAHSIKFYKGDERIKVFIWDLIGSSNEGELKNHTGLSAPVPRGRKGKKAKERGRCLDDCRPLDFDPEAVLDNGYKRHLHRHSNKVLLRVRLLYYIKQEVIGDQAVKVFKGVPASEIDIPTPISDGEVPAAWWDECADRCLLIGVFKHGYEKFNQVRQDPSLCFLSRCGPPDGAALLAEQNDDREDDDDMDDKILKDEDEGELSQSSVPEVSTEHNPVVTSSEEMEGGKYPFPSVSDLNTRLRRVITGYQRNHKKMMMKSEQHARKMERQERAELMVKERESKKKEFQQNLLWCRHSRWSRREEADFYRTVSTFGVEFDRETGRFKWDRFRAFARLDRKYDETLTEYFHAFYYMCQSVCGKFRAEDRVPPPPNCIMVEPITEERASRCLARIDLLNKIRDEVLPHPKLAERLKLCQPSFDMPSWWQCGKHDHELLLGAARHGVSRTEYNILRDPTLSFHEILKNSGRHLRSTPQHYPSNVYAGTGAPPTQTSPAPSREIHDDDLESDAKSQDSAENRDSQTSSPPPLHSGKAQYPGTSSTDTDNEHGPPHLEPAITPQPVRDDDTQDNKSSKVKCEETKGDQNDGPLEQTAAEQKQHIGEKGQGASNSPRPGVSVVKEEYACTGDATESESAVDSQLPVLSAAKDSDTAVDSNLPVLSAAKDSDSAVDSELPVLSAEGGATAKHFKDGVNKEEIISTEEISTSRKEHKFDSAAVSADEKPALQQDKNVIVSEQIKKEVEVKKEVEEFDVNRDKDEDKLQAVKCENTEPKVALEDTQNDDHKEVHDEKGNDLVEEKESIKKEQDNSGSGSSDVKEEKMDYVKLKEKIKGENERILDEEHYKLSQHISAAAGHDGMSPQPASYSIYAEDSPYMDLDGLEPGEIIPGRPFLGPAIEWPKDRVMFHRLEHVCYTIEHGEWPFSRRPPPYIPPTPYDSRSGTPVGTSTPRPDSSLADSEAGDSMEVNQVILPVSEQEKDFEVHLSENEGLKMTFHKRGRGRGRRYEIDAEKMARVQQLLNQSSQGTPSSDNDSQSEAINLSAVQTTQKSSLAASSAAASTLMAESPLNDGHLTEGEKASVKQKVMDPGFMFPERRRRGRKRKAEKLAELAMAEALAKREQARILACLDPDSRVPVINVEDGSILSGDEAPRKRDLERWLREHPGFMISPQPTSFMPFSIPGHVPDEPLSQPPEMPAEQLVRRRGRRPKLDPRTLDAQRLTGEENVSVIERGSGRKITGAKAPPLKHLKEWLEQNPTYDVDPKWGELIRAKGSLPHSMNARLLKPSGRGRKPRSASAVHSSMLGSEYQFGAGMAGLPGAFAGSGLMAAGFPKLPLGMPFANMSGLGMTNPILGLPGFPLSGYPLPGALGKKESEGEGGAADSSKDKPSSSKTGSEAGVSPSTSSAHQSFPLYVNPFLYSPLYSFPVAGFTGLTPLSALNGQSDTALASSEEKKMVSRKEKFSDKIRDMPCKSGEKSRDLSRVIDKMRGMSQVSEKAHSASRSLEKGASKHDVSAQDLSVRSCKDTPSPAHGESLIRNSHKAASSSVLAAEEQATDLSLKRQPVSSSSSTPVVSSKSKNKILSSLKLNKIVDSLKDKVLKIEGKVKKKEEEESVVQDTVTESMQEPDAAQALPEQSSSDNLDETPGEMTQNAQETDGTEEPAAFERTHKVDDVPAVDEPSTSECSPPQDV